MYVEILQELGLSPNEARIYEAFLELGESSVSIVATHANIHRRDVYDVVNRLVEKGFVSPIVGKKEGSYAPVDPTKLLELIEEKKAKLEGVLPQMQGLFEHKKTAERVYIYKGVEGYKNFLRDMLQVKEDVYTISGRGMLLDPKLKLFIENFWKEAERENITFHVLFDGAAKSEIGELTKGKNIIYRVMPKQYSTSVTVDVYGDRVVTVTGETTGELAERLTIFMNISQELADSYRQLFQFMWDKCKAK